jgi:hypothetical protein
VTKARAASLALVSPAPSLFDAERPARDVLPSSNSGSDRRVHTRFTLADLESPLTVRMKYGEVVSVVDLSVGGALLETSQILRPDTNVVVEILDSRTSEVTPIVSRILRAHVAGLNGGIRYRGAFAFKRLLPEAVLPVLQTALPPPLTSDPGDFLKLELALKTIVEGYFKRTTGARGSGRWRDGSALLDALVRLRGAAERRKSPVDQQLAQMLARVIPALERSEPTASVMSELQRQLRQHLPLVAIHATSSAIAPTHAAEKVTLNMCTEPGQPSVSVTAEFAAGFGLNEAQFRLLKVSAYLVGLIEHWHPAAPSARPGDIVDTELSAPEQTELPLGWHRVVLRHLNGQSLRGYSNDFHADRAHLHVCPTVNCADDERLLVPIPTLKAVFFVKDLHGQADRVDVNGFDHDPRGRKVEVTFHDDEVMVGSTLNYKANSQGFFLQPANSQGNNVRSYLVTSSIRHMRFM